MFTKQKLFQVFTYESGSLHRRRPNGISLCENGEEKPPKPPLPLARRGPHLTQQCIGPPHAPPQTAAPTVEALSHTDTVVPIGYNDAPQIHAQKYPFPRTDPRTTLPASSLEPSDL